MVFTDDNVSLLESEKIEFPSKYTTYKISSKHLLIAPEYPTWIVLDDDEYNMFLCLEKVGLGDALTIYNERFDKDGAFIRERLLEKIFNHNFYKDGYENSENEEAIETIQKNIHINLTNDCNMRCRHCFVNAGRVDKKYIDIDKIIQKIDEITKINGYTSVVISGGEPLLHKDIFVLLNALKGHKITLFTNGVLINENNIDEISSLINEIQISMEGISKEAYEKNRGRGNYKRLLNTLNLIKSKNIRLILAITVLPDTLMDIKSNLVEFIKAVDYKNLEIRINNEIEMAGAAPKELNFKHHDMKFSNKIVFELIKKIQELEIPSKTTKQQNIKFKNCGIGTSIVIDVSGKIYPCSKFGSYSLDISQSASEIFVEFDKINRETSIDAIKKCKECDLKYICSGGCRIDNLNLKNSMLSVICDKEYKENLLQRLMDEWEL
ncbi:radical SAM protein [Campylobacter sp. CCUG 57310]|uniref:radical SAM/SPASM domain-containing protein n=1 Tax=Campylobacter sp. CCUG 57310 TaxID=2517362 RepID=UPI0015671338|nr:radical SAM protein [Campylobacter sp. CCUG 57310]QKF91267.1 radical SAM superfamily enzyme, MoaA/NifB/PqqE/SkfB family [Campylobacter sp. CCUG 57310]